MDRPRLGALRKTCRRAADTTVWLLDELRSARRRKQALFNTAREYVPYLAQGLYVSGPGEILRRLGSRLPDHLVQTRSVAVEPSLRRTGGLQERVVGAVLAAIASWVPPVLLVVRNTSGDHTIATTTHEGGVLLFSSHTVTRTLPQDKLANAAIYVRERNDYGRHVPMPGFRIRGKFLIEEFVKGRHFLEVSEERQIEVVRNLLRVYADLVGQEGAGNATETIRAACTMVHESRGAPLDVLELLDCTTLALLS